MFPTKVTADRVEFQVAKSSFSCWWRRHQRLGPYHRLNSSCFPAHIPFSPSQSIIRAIAGHHPSVIKNGKREIGLLKKKGSNRILKPIQEGARGECEVNVYKLLARTLRNSTSGDVGSESSSEKNGWPDVKTEDAEGLARLTPTFYGLTHVAIDKEDHEFLVLDDVTIPYSHPAILDVKMGRITYDPLAGAAKRKKEEIKYPPQKTLGFRLLGYRMHRKGGHVVVKDKEWGKSYDENDIHNGLEEFFSGRGVDAEMMSDVLTKLDGVRQWFATQKSFHFYASSLLFAYENDTTKPPNVEIVMIDFSHVFPANNQPDTNYIIGLDRLYSEIETIHDKFSKQSENS
ncbi:hypothetical protein Q1695_006294 [Nippostrongylus brasiliensis]|nr:hypothetical protein Q1695_006294 [Nippostrongylus brasiliensis]